MRCFEVSARFHVPRWFTILWVALVLACRPLPDSHPGASYPVAPDLEFNRLFAVHGNGWTGGDGTVSIQLPDGRSLWLFGDSFLGSIDPEGGRAADTPFIRNCVLVYSHGRLTPLYGQRDDLPVAFFQPASANEWYWPGDGTVQGGRLLVFLHRFKMAQTGLWGWQWTGTDLAVLGLPALNLEGIQPVRVENGVRYGAALLEHQAHVYIYGVTEKAGRKHLHVARATGESIRGGAWLFFDGDQWSSASDRSFPVLEGVSSQFSVIPFQQGFALITMDGRTPFSGRLVVYTAPWPEGPFRGPIFLYDAPEADRAVAAYNPFVHQQFTHQGHYLISYNVNHLHDPEVLLRDAGLYRPRFIRVNLARFLPQPHKVEHEIGGRWGSGSSRSGKK